MPRWYDIGLNLTHDNFDPDRDDLLAQAREVGVQGFAITGADLAGSQRGAQMARELGGLVCSTAGVHPHHASGWGPDCRSRIQELLQRPEVAAVGEAGLDYFRNFSPKDAQLRCFAAQIELAAQARMPLFVHQRDAHADLFPMLREAMPQLPAAVVHCFTGSGAELEDYLSIGAHIGITGWICDERRGLHLRELVRQIPPQLLMLETDAPYLAPRDLPGRPRRNEPRWLPHVGRCVAECRGEAEEVTARNAWDTSLAFFGLEGGG